LLKVYAFHTLQVSGSKRNLNLIMTCIFEITMITKNFITIQQSIRKSQKDLNLKWKRNGVCRWEQMKPNNYSLQQCCGY
jgi:hypothetical protein